MTVPARYPPGRRIGTLTVIEYVGFAPCTTRRNRKPTHTIRLRCECGATTERTHEYLRKIGQTGRPGGCNACAEKHRAAKASQAQKARAAKKTAGQLHGDYQEKQQTHYGGGKETYRDRQQRTAGLDPEAIEFRRAMIDWKPPTIDGELLAHGDWMAS